MAEKVKVDTEATMRVGDRIGDLSDDATQTMYPLADLQGEDNSLRPGDFPLAVALEKKVGVNADEYMNRLRSLMAAYKEAELAMYRIAEVFEDIESENERKAALETLKDVFADVSSELGFGFFTPTEE